MVKIRQVLRCHTTGLGSNTIAAHLGISRTTVKKYIHIYQTFVAILPCSQLTYAEVQTSQKKEDFIRGCENALRFYGGTPATIVPDNLKSAVTRYGKYESELNEDFAAFAEHHGCTVIPARVRKPKDKALVEDAVKLIYQNIYTQLEGQVLLLLKSITTLR